MTQREFHHLLRSLQDLSPVQLQRLRRELEHELANGGRHADTEGETAFAVLHRAKLIGCIKGAPRSPTDLSTNPRHMEGFDID